jgi:S1-C subfamily serine protease
MRQKMQIASGAAASLLAALFFMSAAPGALRAQQNPSPNAGPFLEMFSGGQRAFLGVTLKDVTAEQVRTMKLPGEYGAIVAQVEPGSPAAKAGLKANDVILAFGGMQVWSAAQLGRLVRETPPGRTVTLRVSRSGEKLNLEANLTARKEPPMFSHMMAPRIHISPNTFNFSFMPARYRLGVHI